MEEVAHHVFILLQKEVVPMAKKEQKGYFRKKTEQQK